MSKQRIKVIRRQATLDDVEGIVRLDNEVWPEFPATTGMITERIKNFPRGNIVALVDGEIVGYLAVQLMDYDLLDPKALSWNELTNFGTTIGTHNPKGKVIFGMADSVSPRFRNLGIAISLVLSGWRIGVEQNVIGCVLGSRIPDYHKHKSQFTVDEYIRQRREDGKFLDAGLRLYASDGFKPIKVVPNYINDPESDNYGVLVYQANPFYNRGFEGLRNFIARIVDRWGHKFLGV